MPFCMTRNGFTWKILNVKIIQDLKIMIFFLIAINHSRNIRPLLWWIDVFLASQPTTSSTAVDRRMHARLSRSGPGFDPRSGQVSWVRFLRGFSSPVRQMPGNFRPQCPRIPFGRYYHQSFIRGANDLKCWRALIVKYTYIYQRLQFPVFWRMSESLDFSTGIIYDNIVYYIVLMRLQKASLSLEILYGHF